MKMISGVALRACVSQNGRRYAVDLVKRAVAAAQARVRSGQMLMLSSHGAADLDDATKACARIVELTCDEDGTARYRARVLPTAAGQDLAALLDEPNVTIPVSIRGRWTGEMQRSSGPEGVGEHGDDLELLGVDATLSPGVEGAMARALAEARRRDPRLVVEAATLHIVEQDDAPTAPVPLERLDRDDFRRAVGRQSLQREAAARAANRARPSWAQVLAELAGTET